MTPVLGKDRQAKRYVDLPSGIGEHGDAALACRDGLRDQGIDHHRRQHISGGPGALHPPEHAGRDTGHVDAVVAGRVLPFADSRGRSRPTGSTKSGITVPHSQGGRRVARQHPNGLRRAMRLQVGPGCLRDGVQGRDVGPLVRPDASGNQPIGDAPVDAPADRHAIDLQGVGHELLSGAIRRVREVLRRRIGRIQDGALSAARDFHGKIPRRCAPARGRSAKHPIRGAVDGGLKLHRAASSHPAPSRPGPRPAPWHRTPRSRSRRRW